MAGNIKEIQIMYMFSINNTFYTKYIEKRVIYIALPLLIPEPGAGQSGGFSMHPTSLGLGNVAALLLDR